MSRHKPLPKPTHCKGWNFHVYTLGSNRCSICGASR